MFLHGSLWGESMIVKWEGLWLVAIVQACDPGI